MGLSLPIGGVPHLQHPFPKVRRHWGPTGPWHVVIIGWRWWRWWWTAGRWLARWTCLTLTSAAWPLFTTGTFVPWQTFVPCHPWWPSNASFARWSWGSWWPLASLSSHRTLEPFQSSRASQSNILVNRSTSYFLHSSGSDLQILVNPKDDS